jgi:hypothetical protein
VTRVDLIRQALIEYLERRDPPNAGGNQQP